MDTPVNQRAPVHTTEGFITKRNHYRVIEKTRTHDAFYRILFTKPRNIFSLLYLLKRKHSKRINLKNNTAIYKRNCVWN